MHYFSRLSLSIFLIGIVALLSSCGGTDAGNNISTERTALLEQTGNNIILPSYQAFQNEVNSLKKAADAFATESTEPTFTALQNQLKATRLTWQKVNLFQFGPAEDVILRASLNTYPTDTGLIKDNIASGEYELGAISNQAAAGFPALGYLLHGTGETNQQIISAYTEASNASKRMDYLLDNISFIKEKTDNVTSAWSDSNLQMFLSDENAGTDTGSSLSMVVNAMIVHYERFLRDGKIGIPAGVRSSGVIRSKATEAFYSGYSVELAIANLQTVKGLYQGTGLDESSGAGLEENLEALGRESLADEIVTELDEAIAALQKLQDPLSEQVETNHDPVLVAFQEMQELTNLLKADMSSALGITITFQDNDGD